MPPLPSTSLAPPDRRQAVVLCGGLATRMYPRTIGVPKFLLPIAGRPFAHHLLGRLAEAGFRDVVLCIGHLGDEIRKAVGDGSAFGLRIVCADEGETRLGTAGALRRALPHLDEAFLVTYGDSYLPFDYGSPLADLDVHAEALGTMSVFHNEDRWDGSNCAIAGERVLRYRKQRAGEARDPATDHIDYGAIALRREVITRLPEGPQDLAPVLEGLAAAGVLRALVVTNRFYEIGSEAGYRELEALFHAGRGGARAEVST